MERSSLLAMGGLMVAVVIGLFVAFWVLLHVWAAFGLLAVVAILLVFAWWYDRKGKRERASLPPY